MDSYLKRKNQDEDGLSKKLKREECPHKERCYRRNPHHFKEFEHPFLIKLVEMGDSPVIPENMPQPKQMYLDQIEILKPIWQTQKASESPKASEFKKKDLESTMKNNVKIELKKDVKPSLESGPSSSKLPGKISRKGKTTKFNSKTEEKPMTSEADVKCNPRTMLDKMQKNSPYNLFFTTIPKSPETYKETNSITFTGGQQVFSSNVAQLLQEEIIDSVNSTREYTELKPVPQKDAAKICRSDLLCPSLGSLKSSLQINFMIDIDWLLKQYKARNLEKKPLTILYGDDWPDMVEFMKRFCPNVKYHFVKMKDPFGCHHSKVGIYAYEDDCIRVVVSTANLYYEDWNHYNQGLWVSPRLPKLPEGSTAKDGESPTGFKSDMLAYLVTYNTDILKDWIDYVKNADFSEVKVALVYSAPGKHYPKKNGNHLHKVGELLSKHCKLPEKTTPQSEGPISWGIMAQASSIGSMGKTAAEWLRGNLLRSLASHKQGLLPNNSQATISLVYPSVDNVAHGYFGLESGGCLPYSKATNEKQRWLQTYMHQWIADGKRRTRAMPHIKSYCRVSPGLNKLAYFLLTSANLSKSAWGNNIQKDGGSYIRSYEVGVMFLPNFFDEEYFEIQNTTERNNKILFPFMYDLPLTPYKKDDYPWCN